MGEGVYSSRCFNAGSGSVTAMVVVRRGDDLLDFVPDTWRGFSTHSAGARGLVSFCRRMNMSTVKNATCMTAHASKEPSSASNGMLEFWLFTRRAPLERLTMKAARERHRPRIDSIPVPSGKAM